MISFIFIKEVHYYFLKNRYLVIMWSLLSLKSSHRLRKPIALSLDWISICCLSTGFLCFYSLWAFGRDLYWLLRFCFSSSAFLSTSTPIVGFRRNSYKSSFIFWDVSGNTFYLSIYLWLCCSYAIKLFSSSSS